MMVTIPLLSPCLLPQINASLCMRLCHACFLHGLLSSELTKPDVKIWQAPMELVTAIFYQSLLVTVILRWLLSLSPSTLLDAHIFACYFLSLLALSWQEPMKKPSLHVLFGLVFSLLLLFRFSASARLILPTRDEKEVKAIDVTNAGSTTELKYDVELVESDECDEEDEECSERRMIAEVHLDYIYSQHHKPAYKHKMSKLYL